MRILRSKPNSIKDPQVCGPGAANKSDDKVFTGPLGRALWKFGAWF
ncbi:hypothetical protein AVEN_110189-1, partial [Araneus ventricosus]